MRIHSLAPTLTLALALTLASGCVTDDDAALDLEDEASITQDLDRGWFGLYRAGTGSSHNSNAAGLLMELTVNHSPGALAYAYAYVQRWSWSPPTSYLTGVVWADCTDGSQPSSWWSFVLTVNNQNTHGLASPKCPPGTGILGAYFYLHVDN